ncbi:nitrilase-related carbon-nitrogen hydrolase, partial [Escherichia coli]|uniref:nitrilase-related carbon-nitrogen hydrolase n=1 Tax=Escherichia coli TaxID=562 RepID=UPI003CE58AF7
AAMIVGGLWCEGDQLYNTLFLIEGGKIVHRQYKHHLPNYGVFDEKRVFTAGPMPEPVEWRGLKLGLMICEDMWEQNVAAHLKAQGA